jgi:biotin synthase
MDTKRIKEIEKKGLKGISKEEALFVLNSGEEDFVVLKEIATSLTRSVFSNRIYTCSIMSAKTGFCSEDCAFCSQSRKSRAEIKKHPLKDVEEILNSARRAKESGARKFCIVMSGRGPSDTEMEKVISAIGCIKEELDIEVDASLGIIDERKALMLKEAGISHYNHNLETSPSHFKNICTTHSFSERLKTLKILSTAGIQLCSGGIFGIGETNEDVVELAFVLKEIKPSVIPINFLHPIKGTPLENMQVISADRALRIICAFRLIHPLAIIKVCGGREFVLKDRQWEIFSAGANGFILGNYLTTKGDEPSKELLEVQKLGFQHV